MYEGDFSDRPEKNKLYVQYTKWYIRYIYLEGDFEIQKTAM